LATNVPHWLVQAIEHIYDPLKSILIEYTQAFSSILLRYTTLNHLSVTVQNMFQQTARLINMANDLTRIDFSDLHEQIHWLIDCDLHLFMKIEQCFKNLFQCQTMLTINNWTTLIETLLDDYLLCIEHDKDYSSYARQFILKTNVYCSLVLRELTLQQGASLGSFHLLQLFIEEYLYYRLEQKISVYYNQTILVTVIDNHEQQRKFNLRTTYRNQFDDDDDDEHNDDDDEEEEEDDDDDDDNDEEDNDDDHDEDDDDDLQSLSKNFNEHRQSLKALSPVPIDEFILPSQTAADAFSYIFEELQPLTNEIF
jgi:hypothetical protein